MPCSRTAVLATGPVPNSPAIQGRQTRPDQSICELFRTANSLSLSQSALEGSGAPAGQTFPTPGTVIFDAAEFTNCDPELTRVPAYPRIWPGLTRIHIP